MMSRRKQNYPIYLITFRESPRREAAIRQLESSGFEFHTVDGVSGSKLNDGLRKRLTSALTGLLFPKTGTMRKGEVACYLSHMLAHREIAASGEKSAVIIEDDAVLNTLFFDFQKTEKTIPDTIDICFLTPNIDPGTRYCKTNSLLTHLTGDLSILSVEKGLSCTMAYWVSREYCRKRLSNAFPIFRAIDTSYFFLNFPVTFSRSDKDLVTEPNQDSSIIESVERRGLWSGLPARLFTYGSPVRKLVELPYRKTVKFLLRNRFLSLEESLQTLKEIERLT